MKRGTAVYARITPSKIVIGADSRTTLIDQSGRYAGILDDTCKVGAVGNELIFASIGVTPSEFNESEVIRNAARAIAGKKNLGRDDLLQVIEAWKKELKERMDALDVLEMQILDEDAPGHIFHEVFFAMRLSDHTIDYRRMAVMIVDGDPKVYYRTSLLHELKTGEVEVLNHFDEKATWQAPGGTDEFPTFAAGYGQSLNRESLRDYVKRTLKEWKIKPPSDEERVRVEVQAAIDYSPVRPPYPKPAVGGHVNEVEIDAKGIRWLTNNPECQQ